MPLGAKPRPAPSSRLVKDGCLLWQEGMKKIFGDYLPVFGAAMERTVACEPTPIGGAAPAAGSTELGDALWTEPNPESL